MSLARFPVMVAFVVAGSVLSVACHQAVKPAPTPAPPAPRPDVSLEVVDPPGAAAPRHYRVKPGHQMVGAAFVSRVLPTYPPALVSRQLPPVAVTATLVADGNGRVTRVLIRARPNAPAVPGAFDEAVRRAVMQWRFSPLRDSVWKTGPDGTEVRVDEGPGKPFSLTYRFHFRLVDGKPVVSSGRG